MVEHEMHKVHMRCIINDVMLIDGWVVSVCKGGMGDSCI